MVKCAELTISDSTFPCVLSTCTVGASFQWDPVRKTRCIAFDLNLYTPGVALHGARDVIQILSSVCYDAVGNVDTTNRGLAALARSTSCVGQALVTDTNGLTALETRIIPWVPPTVPTDQTTCPEVINLASCVTDIFDDNGVKRAGGFSTALKTSKTIKWQLLQTATCGAQTVNTGSGEVILDPCDKNFLAYDDNGLYAIAGASDCFELYIDTDSVACGGRQKVLKGRLIIPDSADQALQCTALGVGVYGGENETRCFKTSVRTQTFGGLTLKTLVGDIMHDPGDDNLLQCVSGRGEGVFFRQCGQGTIMNVVPRPQGGTRVGVDIVLAGRTNNVLSIVGACGSGNEGCGVGLHLGINLNSKCVDWSITDDPCGGKLFDFCVKLGTRPATKPACDTATGNGLIRTETGLWGPPDVEGMYSHDGQAQTGPWEGDGDESGRTLTVTASNCSACRHAIAVGVFRAPAVKAFTSSVTGSYSQPSFTGSFAGSSGSSSGTTIGHEYGRLQQHGTEHPHEVQGDGPVEFAFANLGPSQSQTATLTPRIAHKGATVLMGSYSLEIFVFSASAYGACTVGSSGSPALDAFSQGSSLGPNGTSNISTPVADASGTPTTTNALGNPTITQPRLTGSYKNASGQDVLEFDRPGSGIGGNPAPATVKTVNTNSFTYQTGKGLTND